MRKAPQTGKLLKRLRKCNDIPMESIAAALDVSNASVRNYEAGDIPSAKFEEILMLYRAGDDVAKEFFIECGFLVDALRNRLSRDQWVAVLTPPPPAASP